MEKYTPDTLPDLADIVRRRLETPRPFLDEAEDEVARRLGMPIVRQLTRPDSAPGGYRALRMSNIGSCARSLAYRVMGVPEEGRSIDGRSKVIFAIGDMTESLLLAALTDGMAAGLGPDGWQVGGLRQETGQHRVTLHAPVPGMRYRVPIDGHPDGVLNHEGSRVALVEIKSSSSFGYSKVERDGGWGPEESYWWQAQGYMHAAVVDWMGVILLCKDSGAFTSWWIQRHGAFLDMLGRHLKNVFVHDDLHSPLDRDGRQMAPRMLADGAELYPSVAEHYKRGGTRKNGSKYAKGDTKPGAGALPWQCCYCSHWQPCWGDGVVSRMETDYRGRPSMKLYCRDPGGDDDPVTADPESDNVCDMGDLPF